MIPSSSQTMGVKEESNILSRLERLDIMMWYLEEIRGCNESSLGRSSCDTGSSGGTPKTTDGGSSWVSSTSPRTLQRGCRPVEVVLVETQLKGNLLDRLIQLENRVLKVEQEMELGEERINPQEDDHGEDDNQTTEKKHRHSHKKGLKSLAKSCVKGSKQRSTKR